MSDELVVQAQETFSIDLDSILEEVNKVESSGGGNFENPIDLLWLPAGNHIMRLFVDPYNQYTSFVRSHKTPKGRIVCSNFMSKTNPSFPSDCKLCDISNKSPDYSDKAKNDHIFLCYIYSSDNKEVVPNRPYALMANKKFLDAFKTTLATLGQMSPEYLKSVLNPKAPGGVFSVNVVRGNQGSVNISSIPGAEKPGFELADLKWWVPLRSVWLANQLEEYNAEKVEEAAKLLEPQIQKKLDDKAAYEANKKAEAERALSNGIQPGAAPQAPPSIGQPTQTTPPVQQPIPNQQPQNTATPPMQNTQPPAQPNVNTQVPTEGQVTPTPNTQIPATNLGVDTSQSAPPQAPVESQPTSNMRTLPSGEVVTLPEIAIRDNCWGMYSQSETKCITCSINFECNSVRGQ